MRFTGLNDTKGNPIHEGMYLLLTPPKNHNSSFYGSIIGQEIKSMNAHHFLIYVAPSEYISLDYIACFLKEDNTPFSIYEYEKASSELNNTTLIFENNAENEAPKIFKSFDCYTFLKYLRTYDLTIQESPQYNLINNHKGNQNEHN